MLNWIDARDRFFDALLGLHAFHAPEPALAYAALPLPRPERMAEGKQRLMRLAAERQATLRA